MATVKPLSSRVVPAKLPTPKPVQLAPKAMPKPVVTWRTTQPVKGIPIASSLSVVSPTSPKKPSITSKLKPVQKSTITKPVVTKPVTSVINPTVRPPTTGKATTINPTRKSSNQAMNTVLGAAAGMGASAIANKIFGGGKGEPNTGGGKGAPNTGDGRPVIRPPSNGTKPSVPTDGGVAPETAPITPAPTDTTASTFPDDTAGFKTDEFGNIYDSAGNLVHAGTQTAGTQTTDTKTADSVYFTDGYGNLYDSDGNLVKSADASPTDSTFTDGFGNMYDSNGNLTQILSQGDGTFNIEDQPFIGAKDGGFMTLLYKRGGHVPHFDDGGITDTDNSGSGGSITQFHPNRTFSVTNEDRSTDYYNADGSFIRSDIPWLNQMNSTSGGGGSDAADTTDTSGDVNAGRTAMSDGTFREDQGDDTFAYYDSKGKWLYTTDANGGLIAAPGSNGNPVYYDSQGNTSNSPFSILPSKLTQQIDKDTGVLSSIKDFFGSNTGASVLGALIGNLMSQGSSAPAVNEGVNMAQLAAMQEGAPSGLSIGVGRDQSSGVLVPYEQYASWNPQYEQQLYSDLGVSGADNQEGDTTDQNADQMFQDDQGNYYDAQGNPVDPASFAQPQTAYADGGSTHFTYGKAVSPADNLGMRRGGLSQAYHMHSHHTNPIVRGRIDFRHGSSVNGPGDGQSDDIPAMLADGEYVIDAETVAQLGNGSNKAGAKVLDKFREEIRKHKRNAPLDKIPPKSKSPLAYLKEAMNG